MRNILITLPAAMCLCMILSGCIDNHSFHEQEKTKLFFVRNYKVHKEGVEVWTESETGEQAGKFILHDDVYVCEEEISRVVSVGCRHEQNIDEYLYFSKKDFEEYIKERYGIE